MIYSRAGEIHFYTFCAKSFGHKVEWAMAAWWESTFNWYLFFGAPAPTNHLEKRFVFLFGSGDGADMRRSTSSNQVEGISRSRNLLIKVRPEGWWWMGTCRSRKGSLQTDSKTLVTWWQRYVLRPSRHSKAIYYVGLGWISWNLFSTVFDVNH